MIENQKCERQKVAMCTLEMKERQTPVLNLEPSEVILRGRIYVMRTQLAPMSLDSKKLIWMCLCITWKKKVTSNQNSVIE